LNKVIAVVSDNLLLNGGMVTSLLWWAWVRNRRDRGVDREFVIAGLFLATAGLAVARTMALLLPFRLRPRFSPIVDFHIPSWHPNTTLIDWSSFPSDHAVLFFSLATCLFLISRKVGIFAYFHATFIVCFSLVYFGFHYPTDVLAGALIGIGVASLASIERIRETIARPALMWLEASPRSFYPSMYLCTLLLATQFDSIRTVAVGVWKAVKR
jgi:undecaprenyl-diphosphatase